MAKVKARVQGMSTKQAAASQLISQTGKVKVNGRKTNLSKLSLPPGRQAQLKQACRRYGKDSSFTSRDLAKASPFCVTHPLGIQATLMCDQADFRFDKDFRPGIGMQVHVAVTNRLLSISAPLQSRADLSHRTSFRFSTELLFPTNTMWHIPQSNTF